MSSGTATPVASPAIRRPALFGVLWSGTAFAVLIVAARLGVRYKLCRRLRADDYFVMFALALYTSSTIVVTIYSDVIYNTLDSVASLATILETLDTNSKAMHGILASYLCLWTCLWSIKFSFMAFFANLDKQLPFQTILWRCVLGFLVASYAVCVGLLDYHCLTSQPLEIPEKCMSQGVIHYEYVNTRVTTTLDVISDALIVLIPSNLVWRIKMPWQKKLMLTGICSLTVCMAVVAVVRVTVASPGMLPDLSWLMLWNSVEMTLAIFVACIASFRSLYTRTMEIKKKERIDHDERRRLPWQRPKRRKDTSGKGGILRSFMASDTLLTTESTLWGEGEHQTHTVLVQGRPYNTDYELESQAKLITVTNTFSTSKEDTSFTTDTRDSVFDGGIGTVNDTADVRVVPFEVIPPPPSVLGTANQTGQTNYPPPARILDNPAHAGWGRNRRNWDKRPDSWKY